MSFPRNDKKSEEMYSLYKSGYSLNSVGKAFKITGQGVHNIFKRRGYKLRPKPKALDAIAFNNAKYTLKPNGYFYRTDRKRGTLHRDIWSFHHGEIPPKFSVHHIDGNKQNNSIENLEILNESDHSKKHMRICPKCNHRMV